MRLRHIEVFHAVYTSGSMTKAAALLNVSQPSVSKVLAHAESQVGFTLFERSSGKLIPTPEAIRLFDQVHEVFEALSRVKRVAQNLRDASAGSLRLACTPAMGVSIVPKIVARFMQANKEAFFEIETLHMNEITDALQDGRIDLALAFDPDQSTGLASTPIWTGRFVAIAPEALAQTIGQQATLKDLGHLPFIRLNTRGPLGQLLDAHFDAMDTQLNVVATTETYQLARTLVAEGMGVAVVDEITARSNSVDAVAVIDLKPEINFHVSALRLDQVPASRLAQRFLKFLGEEFSTQVQASH